MNRYLTNPLKNLQFLQKIINFFSFLLLRLHIPKVLKIFLLQLQHFQLAGRYLNPDLIIFNHRVVFIICTNYISWSVETNDRRSIIARRMIVYDDVARSNDEHKAFRFKNYIKLIKQNKLAFFEDLGIFFKRKPFQKLDFYHSRIYLRFYLNNFCQRVDKLDGISYLLWKCQKILNYQRIKFSF